MPISETNGLQPLRAVLFCGILPWTWFSSSLLESSGVLISGGNLIKKVLFPAEVLPIVTVLVEHGALLLRPDDPRRVPALLPVAGQRRSSWRWFPVAVLVQLILTLGFALLLSALTVHFRDLRDILGEPADVLVLRDADHLSVSSIQDRQ